ncbi:response regulator [Pedobacter sp. AW1-32]|uniref:response regulator n=1 Tax=Pedobacter sp. AW1-32 TaxID=3383026 RepID=UPI003FEFFFA4
MFKKVLIAEDHEIANISVVKTLKDLGIESADYVYYCDDALTWIRNAQKNECPYDLLITDLSFEEDHNRQTILNGAELIKAAKSAQPDLKVLVFSSENKPAVIDTLFKDLNVNGFVRKARHDAQNLKQALHTISNGKEYLSPDLKSGLRDKNSHNFTELDIAIITLLAQGTRQKEIPVFLQLKNIKPFGLSSVEKRLNLMREILDFSKNEQLVAYCKDMGII